ncbi:hypothetical protein FA95DRAFT_1606889 [Auriscalpium vulgare]|uniref:Uncharacterized protein n=1 Tax=Auriscalpium vulgare TaxID=40419 RepID=A0ACB8RRH3_9AGAM|nr:hypothetical protein FA95DRAFT_1606889 [Auriscalpium vulgare]
MAVDMDMSKYERIGHQNHYHAHPGADLTFWFFCHISAGHVLLPLLVATFLFSKAKRDITLVNICITFIITGISACLLLYAGQYTGPEPNQILCIIQAGLTESCPPMWATALLAFVIYMRNSASTITGTRPFSVYSKLAMIIAPYIVFVLFLTANILSGAQHPDLVTRSTRFLYCDINSNALSIAAASTTSLISLTAIVLTIQLGVRLWKSMSYMKRAGVGSGVTTLNLRLIIFAIYIMVGFIFTLITLFGHPDPTPRDMYIGTLGLAVFFVFGTQRDVLRVWMFWRRDPSTVVNSTFSEGTTIEITKHGRTASLSSLSTIERKPFEEPQQSPAPIRPPPV